MGMMFHYTEGQTPIDEDEKEGLRIKSITTQAELDQVEQLNIEEAIQWTLKRKFTINNIASEKFIITLHKKMYGNTWKWAGQFRKTNKNIGVDKFRIGIELRHLLDDLKYWIDNRTYDEEEIAVRVKHRIVFIHCFPNGNGRHARLLADVIVSHVFKRKVFTWGSLNLIKPGDARHRYLKAVRTADAGDIRPLLRFARS